MVLVHEFGHFIVAKKNGIKVEEFGFGFPPRLWSIKKGETRYSFNALPFGGFVKILGENGLEKIPIEDFNRSMTSKKKWVQASVLLAGVFANFLLAWILFSITLFFASPLVMDSIPLEAKERMSTRQLIVLSVLENGPAFNAGIKEGDVILSLETSKEKIINPIVTDFISFVNHPEENIHISYLRNKKEMSADIIPKVDESLGRAIIGISPITLFSGKFNFFESINYGFQTTILTTRDTLISFGKLISGGSEGKMVRDSVVGPVGLVGIIGIITHVGFGYLISFVGLISLSLAVINLLPFPALDGGRVLFIVIEKIKGTPIKPKVAGIINMIGFALLIILMIVVTYRDITRLITP